MSIDFYYKPEDNLTVTKDKLLRDLSDSYDIVKLTTNSDNVVTYFAVNPKNKKNIIYEKGFEFHLKDDGSYWHPILTRDDDKFDIENLELESISFQLDLELQA